MTDVVELSSEGEAGAHVGGRLGVYRLLPVEKDAGFVYRQLHDGENAKYIHRCHSDNKTG